MKSPLDNPKLFAKYDTHHVLESIKSLPKQCSQAWEEALLVKLPPMYQNPRNIVVAAMGGSALGARMIKSVFANDLKVSLEIVNHYALPAYVDKDTLVFLVSYSGTTEEVLAAAEEARHRGAKIVGITMETRNMETWKQKKAQRSLGAWLEQHKLPCYQFEPRHNPSGQPRLGTGYTLMGMLAMLNNIGVITPPLKIRGGLPAGKAGLPAGKAGWGSYEVQGNAKQLALKLQNRGLLIFASEHLAGNAHTMSNQINESAKQFAVSFVIPEMNHHLMEGLTFPKLNRRTLAALFLESALYHPRVAVRYPITKEVLVKQNIPSFSWAPKSATRLDQSLETLSFGSFLSFYLAMLNRLDPSTIKWVDYFKSRLT